MPLQSIQSPIEISMKHAPHVLQSQSGHSSVSVVTIQDYLLRSACVISLYRI